MRYTVLIDGEPGAFGVVFPDLPGCTAMGDTIENALSNAVEALGDWIRLSEAKGRPIPSARDLAALRVDPEVKEALAAGAALASVLLVREARRTVKANLSLDAGVLAAIDEAADRMGVTRSRLIEIAAKRTMAELAA